MKIRIVWLSTVYVNNLGAEGPERVLAAYRGNHSRLAELTHTYDPTNVFRMNQNIAPAALESRLPQLMGMRGPVDRRFRWWAS